MAGAAPGNDMNFHGRHIFVIGGSRGIGASCVEMLARRGAVSRARQHPASRAVRSPTGDRRVQAVSFTYASNRSAAEQLEVRTRCPLAWTCFGPAWV